MSAHTPGRLTVRDNGDANSYALLDEKGQWCMSLLLNGQQMTAAQQENMRRLAAAWNAFDGVRTEFVEAMIGTGAMQVASDSMSSLPAALSELNSARALLREVAAHPCVTAKLGAKLKSFLDACDQP